MKNLILSFGLSIVFLMNAYSQKGDSTITIEKRKFYQNDEKLTLHKVKKILEKKPVCVPELQKYKVNAAVGNTCLIVGDVLVLVGVIEMLSSTSQEVNNPYGTSQSSSSTNGVGIMLTGLAFDIVSIPFLISAKHHLKKTVGLYNSSFKNVGLNPVQFNLMVNHNGLGIRMNF